MVIFLGSALVFAGLKCHWIRSSQTLLPSKLQTLVIASPAPCWIFPEGALGVCWAPCRAYLFLLQKKFLKSGSRPFFVHPANLMEQPATFNLKLFKKPSVKSFFSSFTGKRDIIVRKCAWCDYFFCLIQNFRKYPKWRQGPPTFFLNLRCLWLAGGGLYREGVGMLLVLFTPWEVQPPSAGKVTPLAGQEKKCPAW